MYPQYHQPLCCPTQLQELVPLTRTIQGNHDAVASGVGGIWLPQCHEVTHATIVCTMPNGCKCQQCQQPGLIVWCMPFPPVLQKHLVSWTNPNGNPRNTDLELLGSLLHEDSAVNSSYGWECTSLNHIDNTGTLLWQCKGSTTTAEHAASLLHF